MAKRPGKKKTRGGGRKPQKLKGKDVVKTHVMKLDVRVPINQAEAARKERLIREKLTEVAHIEAKIKPLTNDKRKLGKDIKKLADDVDQNSEEREMEVYKVKNYKTHNVQVVDASTDVVLEEHTMTEDESQRDVEEDAPGSPPADEPGDEEPQLQ